MFLNLEAVLEFLICETEEEPRQASEKEIQHGWAGCVGQSLQVRLKADAFAPQHGWCLSLLMSIEFRFLKAENLNNKEDEAGESKRKD